MNAPSIELIDIHKSFESTRVLECVSLRPEDPVLGLSIADQQIVEIIKAPTFEAKVLIMDEPTAALSLEEVRRLLQVVERLRSTGVALMFVSHRLEEVFSISQRILKS